MENILVQKLKEYRMLYVFCMLVHIVLAVEFNRLQLYVLFGFNICSVIMYFMGTICMRRERHVKFWLIAAFIEIIAHAVLCNLYLGYGYGFWLYVVALIPVIYYVGFSSERHAYLDGDNQRVRNQQKVFKAIFKRIISPKMITNYGKFMDALAVAFDTNLSGDEISNFVKYELNNMPDWKIESYAIVAEPDYQFCYQSQSYASVVQQNDVMNEVARKKIKAVLNGKSSTTVEDPSGYSQTASEDNSVGNTEELQNMGILNSSGNDSSEDEEDYNYDYDQSYDDTDYYNPDDQYYQEDTYEDSDYQ